MSHPHRILNTVAMACCLAVLLAAGCTYDGSALDPTFCTENADCPNGQVCVAGQCYREDLFVLDDVSVDQPSDTPADGSGFQCGAALCDPGDACCGDRCVAILTDDDNCGGCGQACAGSEQCVAGTCRCGDQECSGLQSCCAVGGSSLCVTLLSDPNNCGDCGARCAQDEQCIEGNCTCEGPGGTSQLCQGELVCCPGAAGCRDLDNDRLHCGRCEVQCGSGEVCESGACVCGSTSAPGAPACVVGEKCCGPSSNRRCLADTDPACDCGGGQCGDAQLCCPVDLGVGPEDACVFPARDSEHCGDCGEACDRGEVCVNGSCQCESGWVVCGGRCINPDTDRQHCGASADCATLAGTTCEDGFVCNGSGVCALSCQSGLTECNGECVNLRSDTRFCSNTTACGTGCQSGFACDNGVCVLECQAGLTACSGECVNLLTDNRFCSATGACGTGCADGFACNGAGACVLSCQDVLTSCGGECVNLLTDRRYCSATATCGTGCAAGFVCDGAGVCALSCQSGLENCNGTCADLDTEARFCGNCNNDCTDDAFTTRAGCELGLCAYVCDAGRGDCSATTAGCETNLFAVANCGACGAICGSQNAAPTCTTGVCNLNCTTGWADCDGDLTNGCETPLNTTTNCGVCGHGCGPMASCVSGQCDINCAAGTADCDGLPSTGCEIAIVTNINCGGCGQVCSNSGASSRSCATGSCALTCDGTHANCDGLVSNGCETSTAANASNCGGCGIVCGANQTCSGGECVCNTGFGDCDNNGDSCETAVTSVTNCGGCGIACGSQGTSAASTCTAGACVVTCDATHANCNGRESDGCEVAIDTTSNCGGCGIACGSGQACTGGECVCNTGFGDCNGDGRSCETPLDTVTNCGACGVACGAQGTSTAPTCTAGACVLTCDATHRNCNGLESDGCETLITSDTHCGACGNACDATQGCVSRACACDAGRIDCDGDGADCEVDGLTDEANCGGCGIVCGASAVCVNGTCRCDTASAEVCYATGTFYSAATCDPAANNCALTCTSGHTDCDGNPATGCEVYTGAPGNCGGCGVSCSTNQYCNGTGCACMFTFADCTGAAGCETNTYTDEAHCGGCGLSCGANASCDAGGCACRGGYADCNGSGDGSDADGCESDLSAAATCGGCGTSCTAGSGATAVCASGTCGIECSVGFGDCDGDGVSCEATLATSETDCGFCDNACGTGQSCSAGVCTCDVGMVDCSASVAGCETAVLTDEANCGGCGIACGTAAVCVSGECRCDTGTDETCYATGPLYSGATCDPVLNACTLSCTAGYDDCDSNPTNGCEVYIGAPGNCGGCGVSCEAQEYCDGTACACMFTYADCNGGVDGCETNTYTDEANCGGCGIVCGTNAFCDAGACACEAGFADCDGDGTCESDLSSAASCGACGTVCTAGLNATAVCVDPATGTCGFVCDAGFADCDVSGSSCEIDVLTDADNCGACGTVCPNQADGGACEGGVCSKVVFVTSTASDGNLGGVSGADVACQALATSAGLTGTYRAWLSDSTTSPAADAAFLKWAGAYRLTTGTKVASGWTGLTSGSLLAAINRDENQAAVGTTGTSECGADTVVWSYTFTDGTAKSTDQPANAAHCGDWTQNGGGDNGHQGNYASSIAAWTDYCDDLGDQSRCSVSARLYCFEQ